MSPAHVRKRVRGGRVRWVVEYRVAGRASRVQHGGSFDTKGEAEARKRWIEGELAAMRVPDLRALAAPPAPRPTLAEAVDGYAAGRVDVGHSRQKTYRQARARLGALGELEPHQVTRQALQAWVTTVARDLAPKTISEYLGVIRQVLDAEGVAPNPALRIPIPRGDGEPPADPPSWQGYQAMLDAILPRHRPAVALLEGTGLRVGELARLRWQDVDLSGGRLRIPQGKTGASRRWVPVTPWAREVLERTPLEDRLPGGLVCPLVEQTLRGAMARACSLAGLPAYSPHDLRHRFASLLVLAGVPMPLVKQIMGHTRASVTLDVYGHVLLDEPQWRLRALLQAVADAYGMARVSDLSTIEEAR